MNNNQVSVLFVCMGNICRSPTAEGVFRKFVEDAGLSGRVLIDSAGTHAYHQGAGPDRRAREAAARRGVQLQGILSRPVTPDDFRLYDHILAMDNDNLDVLRHHAGQQYGYKVQLFLDYASHGPDAEVPDPYYGGAAGFERVLDLVEEASRGLLLAVRGKLSDA